MERNSTGAAIGRTSSPMSPVPLRANFLERHRRNVPFSFRRSRPLLVALPNRGCSCLLSARLRAGKSPALTGHLSTGNRRQHRVLIGWLFESRGPLHNCGGKSGLLPERKNGVQLELSGMALNGRVGWLRGYAEEDKKASQQTLCCDGAQKTKRIAPRRLRSEYGLGPEHFHVLARTLCIKGES